MECFKCKYVWETRKENPKECPRCKTRLDNSTEIKTKGVNDENRIE